MRGQVYAINIRNGRGAYPPRAFDFIAGVSDSHWCLVHPSCGDGSG